MSRPVLVVEKHDVHVAERIEFAAAVAAERDDGERSGGGTPLFLREAARRRRRCGATDVDQLDAERANFPAASAGLMAQAQPVLLDFQKLLVKRQSIPSAASCPVEASSRSACARTFSR